MLWRGHFKATGDEKSVRLVINGGEGVSSKGLVLTLYQGLSSVE